MAGTFTGVNNFTDTSGTRNTIEDYSAVFRGIFTEEGIIDGLTVHETNPISPNVFVEKGMFAIDGGGDELLIFRLKADIVSLPVPNIGTLNTHYLVVAKLDLTNATIEIEVVEGALGGSTDPDLAEGGSPEVYFVVLAQIIDAGGDSDIDDVEILQDGLTETNNSTPEVIGRQMGLGRGWTKTEDIITISVDTDNPQFELEVNGDKREKYSEGIFLKILDSTDTIGYFIVNGSSFVASTNITTLIIYGATASNLSTANTITTLWYGHGRPTKTTSALVHPTAKLEKSGNQSIPNNVLTTLTWDTVLYDNGQYTDTVDQFIIPVDGRYNAGAFVLWDTASTGDRFLDVLKNAGAIVRDGRSATALLGTRPSCSIDFDANQGDVITVQVLQNQGSAIDVRTVDSQFWIKKLSNN